MVAVKVTREGFLLGLLNKLFNIAHFLSLRQGASENLMSLFADSLRDPLGRHIILYRLWRGESGLSKSLGCDLVSHDHRVRVLLQLGACIFRVLL